MTLQVIFHELAERELNDAAAYYYAQDRPGLGEAFLAEVERVTRLLAESPWQVPRSERTSAGGVFDGSLTPSSTGFARIIFGYSRSLLINDDLPIGAVVLDTLHPKRSYKPLLPTALRAAADRQVVGRAL